MALIFEVKVIPSSGDRKWILDKSGILKCYLKNPPENGKANKEFIKFLSESLQCLPCDIEIIIGLTCRKKRIKINKNLTYDTLLKNLGLITGQQLIFSLKS